MSGPRLPRNRAMERAGVRAVTEFFDLHGGVIQPVDGQNDFGKDLYLDLTLDSEITGVTCAVQVKSGPTYKTSAGYQIPIDQHLHCWRNSTIPVIGIVHDPDQAKLAWINLSQHLRTRTDSLKHVPIPATAVLNSDSLEELERNIRETSTGAAPVLAIWSSDEMEACQAVWDCTAVGRRDARVLKNLRASIPLIDDAVLPVVVHVLSRLSHHSEWAWRLDDTVRTSVRETFRWTVEEIIRMIKSTAGDWGRGTIGQDVTYLLAEDPEIREKLPHAIKSVYSKSVDESWMIFCVYLYFCDDRAGQVMKRLLRRYREFRRHPVFQDLVEHINANGGCLSLND